MTFMTIRKGLQQLSRESLSKISAPDLLSLAGGLAFACLSTAAQAGVTSSGSLTGGNRWDAAPRNVPFLGERSLAGGLRYNMQGGSYESYRDLFAWSGAAPSASEFRQAVDQAFRAWESVDPVSGFGTSIRFVWDPTTPVKGIGTGNGIFSREGAEIDLFAATATFNWSAGNTGLQGEASVAAVTIVDMPNVNVTLTSGTTNYAGARAIAGADIIINSNPGALWTLDSFRRILTHEIGHTLGFGDIGVGTTYFIDDNYNPADPAGTLTNNWAHLVDPHNPSASPLFVSTNPNVAADGVDILMEHAGVGVGRSNGLSNLIPLSADEFSTRQFLYPELAPVPEPHEYALLMAGLALVLARVRPRKPPSVGS